MASSSTTFQTDGKQEEDTAPVGSLLETDNTESRPLRPSNTNDPSSLQIKTRINADRYGGDGSSINNNIGQKGFDEKTSIMTNSRFRSKWFNIYIATAPLGFIFLFDILPSRVSLIFIGHLLNTSKETAVDSLYDFDAMFAAYGFTNFFVVFILSLSCGLDTLSKQQLRNIEYFRHASILVLLGVVPYILACVYARDILYYVLSQPSFIIEKAHNAVQFLIGYCLCYVIFAMLRKSLLQYLNSSLLVGIMFVRLCLHIMIGYFLFEYNSTNLGMYCFAISDSISMVVLLIITIITLAKFVDFKEFIKALLCLQSNGYKRIMNPSNANSTNSINSSDSTARPTKSSDNNTTSTTTQIPPSQNSEQNWSNFQSSNLNDTDAQSLQLFKEYLSAMIIPGAISCLEWWAVEAITWLVGGLETVIINEDNGNIYIYYFVHAVYSSMLLIVQMPMLGLSVAMAAIITADIRLGRFSAARYTFIQGLISSLIYLCIIAAILLVGYNRGLLNAFFDLPVQDKLGYIWNADDSNDQEYVSFVNKIYLACDSINIYFIISVGCYSVSMCFLALFVSVGRLAKGGSFMLIGYYVFGLFVSAMLGYVLEWGLKGIWFGYSCGFLVWCLLSGGYWICFTNWKNEMRSMKAAYDDIERYEKGTKMFKQKLHKNYGTIRGQ